MSSAAVLAGVLMLVALVASVSVQAAPADRVSMELDAEPEEPLVLEPDDAPSTFEAIATFQLEDAVCTGLNFQTITLEVTDSPDDVEVTVSPSAFVFMVQGVFGPSETGMAHETVWQAEVGVMAASDATLGEKTFRIEAQSPAFSPVDCAPLVPTDTGAFEGVVQVKESQDGEEEANATDEQTDNTDSDAGSDQTEETQTSQPNMASIPLKTGIVLIALISTAATRRKGS